jgi:hypothetical protein
MEKYERLMSYSIENDISKVNKSISMMESRILKAKKKPCVGVKFVKFDIPTEKKIEIVRHPTMCEA